MPDFTGFVGPAYTAASPTQDCQELINWYPETDSSKFGGSPSTNIPEQRGAIALYPCPGLVTRFTLSGQVRGFNVLPGSQMALVAAGNTLYTVVPTSMTTYATVAVGTLLSNVGQVYICNNGATAYITDGTSRYYYTWGTNTFAAIADGAFVNGNVCGEMDNFMFYNRPGTNQWGCTDVSTFTSSALNLGAKIGASGNIVGLIADKRQVLVIGERTSEKWSDVGSFPFPFAIQAGTSIQHGCLAQDSIAFLGEGVAMLALDDRGQSVVVVWGASLSIPQRISTHAIENIIQRLTVVSDAIGYTYSQAGHEFYVLTFPSADLTLVYDLASQMWHKRAWRDSNNVYHRHRSNCCMAFNNEILVGDWQNGKVYAMSLTTFTDDGATLPCIRRAPHLTNDLRRQYFTDLQVQFQPGVGLQANQGSDPECILRWSNDGGFTFGNDHVLKIGKVGQYLRRAIKRRLGYARDRVFEIECTDPVYRVIVSAELNTLPGAN